MHEIVTLSLGRIANHVTTHTFNTKLEYLNEGSEAENEVYFASALSGSVPRVCHFDLSDGFGAVRRDHVEGETGAPQLPDVKVYRQPALPKSDYLIQLEKEDLGTMTDDPFRVNNWSDFSRLYYSRASFVSLPPSSYTYANADLLPFGAPDQGREEFGAMDRAMGDGIVDQVIRPWAEACDSLQGFQVLTCSSDAWSAFTRECLEQLSEQYGQKSVVTVGLGQASVKDKVKTSDAMSLLELSAYSSLYIPCLDLARRRQSWGKSLYETTAVLSASLETVLLPCHFQVDSERLRLADLCSVLNGRGDTPVVGLSGSFKGEALYNMTMETTMGAGAASTPPTLSSVHVARSAGADQELSLDPGRLALTTPRLYPLPRSFPDLWHEGRRLNRPSIGVHSQLSTSSLLADSFSAALPGLPSSHVEAMHDLIERYSAQ